MILTAHNLAYRYRGSKKDALHSIQIELQPGEICGLVGANGAGKTTLISLLTTILPLQQGSLSIDGITVGKGNINRRKVCKKISLIPQDTALYEKLTGRENLRYFGHLHGISTRKGKLSKRVEELLETVGLQHRGDELVKTYSGGMKRRLNLAVGLVHKPKILFLDEPTIGIDARSRHLIISLLKEMKENMTLLYASHYLEEVEELCDRTLFLDGGTIVEKSRKRHSGFSITEQYYRFFAKKMDGKKEKNP